MQLDGSEVNIVIVTEDSPYQPASDQVVMRSPSSKGMLLIRMLLPNRDDEAQIQRLQRIQSLAKVELLTNRATEYGSDQ